MFPDWGNTTILDAFLLSRRKYEARRIFSACGCVYPGSPKTKLFRLVGSGILHIDHPKDHTLFGLGLSGYRVIAKVFRKLGGEVTGRNSCYVKSFLFRFQTNTWTLKILHWKNTPPKFNMAPGKMLVGILLSYWVCGNFSGAKLLNFGRVSFEKNGYLRVSIWSKFMGFVV